MAKHEVIDMAWSDLHQGLRVRFATPRFIKIGTVVKIKGRGMRIQFDGEPRLTTIPDAKWYFVEGKAGNKEEHLVVVDAPTPTKALQRTPKGSWEFIPVSEAAQTFGVDAKTIRRWLRSGKVKGHQANGSTWMVETQSLGQQLAGR